MSDILSVGSKPIHDDNIIKSEFHSNTPYISSFANNDGIRIAIQSQDLYIQPSESYILVDVRVERKTGAAHAQAVGTWSAYMLDISSYPFIQ